MEENHITDSFETFFVRPSGLQYTIDQLPWIIIILIGLITAGTESCPYRKYIFYGVFVLLAYLYYRAFEFRRIAYIVTGEQLIYQHGVFFHKSDYMELYRIVDYQESRTPMQQLTAFCTSHHVHTGILTVPASSAQSAADKMISAGLTAILNFAPVPIKVPSGVTVHQENIALSGFYRMCHHCLCRGSGNEPVMYRCHCGRICHHQQGYQGTDT